MSSGSWAHQDSIKLFCISNQLLENDLNRIERQFGIDLNRGHTSVTDKDETYYPQIDQSIRSEAQSMGDHYEVFYSLEKTIRSLISDALEAAEPSGWWGSGKVPQKIKTDAEARMKKEVDSGVTPRSRDPIDFTNFGELGEIIKGNLGSGLALPHWSKISAVNPYRRYTNERA